MKEWILLDHSGRGRSVKGVEPKMYTSQDDDRTVMNLTNLGILTSSYYLLHWNMAIGIFIALEYHKPV